MSTNTWTNFNQLEIIEDWFSTLRVAACMPCICICYEPKLANLKWKTQPEQLYINLQLDIIWSARSTGGSLKVVWAKFSALRWAK
jgi:hypothetical protein